MRDLTSGNEGRLILNFAVPMLIGNVFQQFYQVVDSIIVGHYLGKEALAAVGASFPVIFGFVSLIIGVTMGASVIIAQYFGAKDLVQVKRTIDTLYITLFFSSLVLTVCGILFSRQIFIFMQLPENILPMAVEYLSYYMLGFVAFFGFNGTAAILRGLGDSKTTLYFLVGSTIINIGLDLLFILTFEWGVRGAALATVVAQSVALIAAMVYINKTHKIIRFATKTMVFDKPLFLKSVKIGLPSGLQQSFVALGMMALMAIVNGFGTNVIAAYSVAARIDSLASMPAMNFSMALSAFVGQNLGAGKEHRVGAGLRATMAMSSVVALSVSFVVIFFGDCIMKLFTTDAAVIAIGHEYLMIVGGFYVIFNAMFTLGGVMRGAGDTLIPMFVTLFSLWIIRIPLAYFLSGIYGEKGIWWSIPIAWAIGAAFSYFYYKTGRWKRKVIVKQTEITN